jgi:hypothetical protein
MFLQSPPSNVVNLGEKPLESQSSQSLTTDDSTVENSDRNKKLLGGEYFAHLAIFPFFFSDTQIFTQP